MDIESRLSISYYKNIATVSEPHKIYIVQHMSTGKIYVKKVLDIYNKAVYEYLINHPIAHTPKIYEVYEESNTLTIIEEYISGDTLEEILDRNTLLSNDKIREIAIKLCTIVKNLHDCNPAIIHRDIKPSNIIIVPSGELYLLDFNASKYNTGSDRTEDTTLLGTKGYAAPEQYGFGVSTTQTDIYAIGMTLKEMTSSKAYLESKQKNEFATIINKSTRLNSDERYKDVASLLRILSRNEPEEITVKKAVPRWRSYLPPGFRTLSPINMVLAIAGYGLIISICLSLQVKDSTPAQLCFERIFSLLALFMVIFFSANYRNVQSCIPICRTQNIFLRILSIALMDVLIFLALLFIMTFIASIIP